MVNDDYYTKAFEYASHLIKAVDYDKSSDWIIYSDDYKLFFVDRNDGKI